MMSFFEIVNLVAKGGEIPPIMRGTKVMIKQLVREERKIAAMNEAANLSKRNAMTRPKEDMAEIFTKYVNQDFNKDAYLFIK